MTMWGADVDELETLSSLMQTKAQELDAIHRQLGSQLHAAPWSGGDADQFRSQWSTVHGKAVTASTGFLRQGAKVLHDDAVAQRAASEGGTGSLVGTGRAGFGAGGGGGGGWGDDNLGFGDILDLILEGKEIWGSISAVRAIPMLIGLMRAADPAMYLYKLAQLGIIPSTITESAIMSKFIPALAKLGGAENALAFIASPAGQKALTGLGVGMSAASTALGLYGLYQQGNPIEAFKKNPSGYASDVAGTAFSASTTVFLINPLNPVAAGAVVVTGVLWAGTEVWDHWDDVSAGAGKAWDWTGDRFEDAGDWAGDRVDDVKDFAGDRVDDVKNFAKNPLGSIGIHL